MTWVLVAVGAALGAPARYLLGVWLNGRAPLPWGTFAVNATGSMLLGLLVGSGASDHAHALLGVGFCGAFTTYSTFAWEVHSLVHLDRVHATTYTLLSTVAGVTAAGLGWWAGASL